VRDPVADSKTELKRWIETSKTLQRTKRDWKVDKATLDQSIGLLERELRLLDSEIGKLEAGATEGATQRQELSDRQATLKQTAETVSKRLKTLENRLLALAPVFPRPLADKTKPLMRRLKTGGGQGGSSLGQRLQALLGILNEVDKFNGSLTLTGELRNIDGKQTQVETLYMGLSQAYYVDRTGSRAGVGVPSAKGWEWTPRNELAHAVTHVLLVYRSEHPAEFIELPVTLK
jgi:DNA repair exonuclease SbcCD ATPase subunit